MLLHDHERHLGPLIAPGILITPPLTTDDSQGDRWVTCEDTLIRVHVKPRLGRFARSEIHDCPIPLSKLSRVMYEHMYGDGPRTLLGSYWSEKPEPDGSVVRPVQWAGYSVFITKYGESRLQRKHNLSTGRAGGRLRTQTLTVAGDRTTPSTPGAGDRPANPPSTKTWGS